MNKIIVLGAGMVGSAMAIDLANKHEVSIADKEESALQKAKKKCKDLQTVTVDVSNRTSLTAILKPFDIVINAVPGFLGFETLKTIIMAGKNVVDIAFFPEDAFLLDELARENGVTAIVDCGVAPGMGNVILGYHNEIMELTDFECLVGGLPLTKKWPFAYKAPFSPVDVIEEYTRPARYVENGKMIIREPLTDCEYVDFDGIGTLESFNSDGLRSIIKTMNHIPNLKEKTLRYPGHVEYIKVLKESGFFNRQTIRINGQDITPLEFTSQILFDEWKLGDHEPEMTVMRITLKGLNEKKEAIEVVYQLHDEYDQSTETSSMARTTGYTATAAANLVLDGLFLEKGIFPPELLGKEKACFDYILAYLIDRNIHYHRSVRKI